ncbi:MAG: MoaD/ThiS family protein [Proteobacteria bacterium]|nr:MoaD/ThiS family protein [Pseudomonadota bacterium]
MKIDVYLFISLSKYLPEQAEDQHLLMELDEDTTVGQVLSQLGVPIKTVKIVFVNGVHATMDTVLQDGDRMGAFPPVGGG